MFSSHTEKRRLAEPSRQNLLSSGHLATLYRLSDNVIRKMPCDYSYDYSTRAIQTEAWIYQHLGKHKYIARFFDAVDDHIDLKYERNGDLEIYLQTHRVSPEFRYRAACQAVKAVHYIHQEGVVHADLSARQFLVDEKMNLRLSDFCGSSLNGSQALVLENPTHYLPRPEMQHSTVKTDIFALGSTLYEILKGEKPYQGKSDGEVQYLYKRKIYPDLGGIGEESWRRIIHGCWTSHYASTGAILEDIPKKKKWYRFCG